MQPFVELSGIAAPLFEPNIDTDQIIPVAFLKTITRTGLARGLFHSQRHDAAGRALGGFVLDRAPFDQASILIAGENFGCGSSREHAPWALLDFGIRCVIAPSFGDIFYTNCINNGLLPIILSSLDVQALAERAAQEVIFVIDLVRRTIVAGDLALKFVIDRKVRADLLSGSDVIERSYRYLAAIEGVEARVEAVMPWLPQTAGRLREDRQ